MHYVRLAALLLATLCAGSASAQLTEMIPNGEFDADAAGWAPNTGSVSVAWSNGFDRDADPQSGAGLVSSDDERTFVVLGMGAGCQALPAGVGGGDYDFEASALYPQGQSEGTRSVDAALRWYDAADCVSSSTTEFFSFTPLQAATWIDVAEQGTIPETANAVRVDLTFLFDSPKNAPDGTFEIYFDGVSLLVPEPGAAAQGLAALLALAALPRRRPASGRSIAGLLLR